MRPHENLKAWKLSFFFVKDVYVITSRFPSDEKFGMVSQLRRAAVSVPVNIAEGAARQSKREFRRFLFIACGSLSELETLLKISKELEYINEDSLIMLLGKLELISKIIPGLIKTLE